MEMLDTSNASFWVHENLLEPQSLQQQDLSSSAQQQSAHHLFPAHPAEAAVLHPEEVCLELGGYGTCGGAFPQTVQQHHSDSLQGSAEDRQFMPSLNALPEFRYIHKHIHSVQFPCEIMRTSWGFKDFPTSCTFCRLTKQLPILCIMLPATY